MKLLKNIFNLKDNIINISFSLFLFIIYALFILGADYFLYILKINSYIPFLLSGLVITVIIILLRKKIKINFNFSWYDLIFYFLLLFIMVITIVFPDRSFDSLNYHIYLQNNPFNDRIYYDFFPGRNINSYSYSLGDRMFYPLVYAFGYRIGLILNYFIFIVLFYQIKKVFKCIFKNIFNYTNVILSILVLFTLASLDLLDSYSIDLFYIIPLLQIVIIIFNYNKDIDNNWLFYAFLGILSGLAITFKISNIPLVFVLGIIFILKYRKNINKKTILNFVFYFLFLIIPIIGYAVYNYRATGNPVFPYYNEIFRAKLFPVENWKDAKFGPQNWFQFLIYPVYIIKYPALSIDHFIVDPMWAISYVISICYLLYGFIVLAFKKIKSTLFNKNIFLLSIIYLVCEFVWIKFMIGYTRYAIIVLIIGYIVYLSLLIMIINSKKFPVLALVLIILGCWNLFYTVDNFANKKLDYIFNNYYNNSVEDYKYNIDHLFDKSNSLDLKDNSAFVVMFYNSAYSHLLNDDVPIINYIIGKRNDANVFVRDELLKKYDHYYTFADDYFFENVINELNVSGMKIINIEKVDNSMMSSKNNTYLIEFIFQEGAINTYSLYNNSVLLDLSLERKNNISFWYSIERFRKNSSSDYYLLIKINGKEFYFETIDYQLKEINIDYKATIEDKIEILVTNKDKLIVPDNLLIVNN